MWLPWRKKKPVFDRIEIHLTHPICGCLDGTGVTWGWERDGDALALWLTCVKCKTRLVVPFRGMKAAHNVKNPNPPLEAKKVGEKYAPLRLLPWNERDSE